MYSLISKNRTVHFSRFFAKNICRNCWYSKHTSRFRNVQSCCTNLNIFDYNSRTIYKNFEMSSQMYPASYLYTASHSLFIPYRNFYTDNILFYAEGLKPSSKVEETVQAIKDKENAKILASATGEDKKIVPVKKSIKQKVIDELVHYYHGFRLLFIDIKISSKLVWRILKGQQLTRREHNLLVRTVSDMFRLVPFSVFIIVPFMEFLLPFFIKFFPGMLPSTFQTESDKEDKIKQSLKIKIEMAKFLQETLDNMTVKAPGHSSKDAKEFAEFFQKVRSEGGGICTSGEIMKFSKLFEDEITLDSLPRPQLVALCRVLEIQPIGTSNLLRFQLRMKMRSLAADDLMIQREGIDSLSLSELQTACRSRGMRAYGLSSERLKFQLGQWLDLSLNKKVPPSLLLLSRAFMLPETIPTTDKLKATISALPEAVAVSTKAAIGEREGKVDNKTKIELIKEEERRIQEEKKESAEEKRLEEELEQKEKLKREAELLVDKAAQLVDKAIDLEPQVLRDTAKVTMKTVDFVKKKIEAEEVTPEDIKALDDALDILSDKKKNLAVEKEELQDLKEELAEYKEDVDDLNDVLLKSEKQPQLKESVAAKRLFKKVNSMISQLDQALHKLEDMEQQIKQNDDEKKEDEVLRIDELMDAIRKIQKIPDESKLERIKEVLSKIDEDHDGAVRIDTVLKVLELIGEENVKLSKAQIDDIIDLLEKEKALEELDERNDKTSMKEKSQNEADDKLSASEKLKIPGTVIDATGKTIPPTADTAKKLTNPTKTL